MSKRDNLADHLPRVQRKQEETPKTIRKSRLCEWRYCPCIVDGKHTGGADIVIYDRNGQFEGYVCCRGYDYRMREVGKNSESTWRETGTLSAPVQPTLNEQHTAHRLADLVNDFDRYADNVHDREDGDA